MAKVKKATFAKISLANLGILFANKNKYIVL